MLCNPVSCYPDKIDEMIFFQDNSLEKADALNHYNSLVSQGKYSEAGDFINRQEEMYGFFADFFNLTENRIHNTQEYLLHKPPKKQPFLYYDVEEHLPADALRVFTDTGEEEPLSSIFLFSSSDEPASLDGLFLFTGAESEPPNADTDTIWI